MAASVPNKRMKTGRVGLKKRPLRLPGQSTEEYISKLRDDSTDVLLLPAIWVVVAMVEWWRWWFAVPPSPWVPSLLAVVSAIYAYWRYVPLRSQLQNYRLGRDGERLVAEILEQLRAKGYRVFHDVLGEGFNIDHVIVGAAGVFMIETKTRSKPSADCYAIAYDGETVRIGNGIPTKEPLNQARAQARWLADLLNDGRSSQLIVRPVVVFPEWYVEQIGEKKSDIWVLNPKALDQFLQNEPPILTTYQIDSVANVLTCHARQRAA